MSMISICVQRDSVCAGDDIDTPHTYEFEINETCTLGGLFKHLKTVNYLPKVMGRKHEWRAQIEGDIIAQFKGNRKKPIRAANLQMRLIDISTDRKITLIFKYISAET